MARDLELILIAGAGAGTHAENHIPHLQRRIYDTGGSDADNVLHIIKVIQLIRIDSDGRHAHARCHHGHFFSIVSSGVALNTTHIVHQHSILKERVSNELCPKRVTRHQNSFGKIARFCRNMRCRCTHFSFSFPFSFFVSIML